MVGGVGTAPPRRMLEPGNGRCARRRVGWAPIPRYDGVLLRSWRSINLKDDRHALLAPRFTGDLSRPGKARIGDTALRTVRGGHGNTVVAAECRDRRAGQGQS